MQHHALVQDCFHSVLRLRSGPPSEAIALAQDVHAVLSQALGAMLERPQSLGLTSEDAKEVAYAVVALADEAALSQHDDVSNFWSSRLLQTQFFGENDAGEQFFHRLERLLIQTRLRRAAVMTYFTALALGFVGRFGGFQADPSGLKQVRERVHTALSEAGVLVEHNLSPKALTLAGCSTKNRRTALLRRMDTVVGAVALVVLILSFLLRSIQEGRVNAVIERSELALVRLGKNSDRGLEHENSQSTPEKSSKSIK